MKFLLVILFFFFSALVYSQTRIADSLLEVLKTAPDTAKPRLYYLIGWEIRGLQPEKSLDYMFESLNYSNKYKNEVQKGFALNGIGSVYIRLSKYDEALKHFNQGLAVRMKLNDSIGIAKALTNIGNCYGYKGDMKLSGEYMEKAMNIAKKIKNEEMWAMISTNYAINLYVIGDFNTALKYFFESLEFFEKKNDLFNSSQALMNIGSIYNAMGKNQEAKNFLLRAKDYAINLDDKKLLTACYNNLATIYYTFHDLDSSKMYCMLSINLAEEIKCTSEISDSYNVLAFILRKEKKYKEALDLDLKNLAIRISIGDSSSIAETYCRLGIDYCMLNDKPKCIENFTKSIEMYKMQGYKHQLMLTYQEFAKANLLMKDFEQAYYALENYMNLKDSALNSDLNSRFAEMQTKYETEKKEKENQLLIKESELKTSELKKKEMWMYFLVGGILLLLLLAFFIFRSYRIKKRSNLLLKQQNYEIQQKNEEITAQRDEIESQRDEIEAQRDLVINQKNEIEIHRDEIAEQKKEILDSIHYAKRIQKALLPPEDYIAINLPEHFILFKPRDIVSGDFYWAKVIQNRLVFCVADCTGHGVPGAFMSMLGVAFLNEITNTIIQEKPDFKASDILDKLRANVISALHQTGKQGEQKDGMDIALCILDLASHELQFSGAYNPLYIIKNPPSQESDVQLVEVKGDKMPIGIYHGSGKDFTNHQTMLQKGDRVYIFSDGYADQFGGEDGKKFKYSKFKELLISMHDNTIEDQKHILNYAFEQWKENYAQIDDVCVFGLRI